MENTILLAAVYIDPMNRVLLNEEQHAKAKEALCDVAIRMKGILLVNQDDQDEEDNPHSSPSTDKEDFQNMQIEWNV